MTKAPERIWIHPTEKQTLPAKDKHLAKWLRGKWKDHDGSAAGDVEYVRADTINAIRDKTTPAVNVDIDALAYRFWSIHPKDIPDPVGMPDGYKGGARAWMYATEIRAALRAIAGVGDE